MCSIPKRSTLLVCFFFPPYTTAQIENRSIGYQVLHLVQDGAIKCFLPKSIDSNATNVRTPSPMPMTNYLTSLTSYQGDVYIEFCVDICCAK